MATHQRIEQPSLFPSGPHGNVNPLYIGEYKRGCRCTECVSTYKEYRHLYHKQRLARDPAYRAKCESHSRRTVSSVEARRRETVAKFKSGELSEHASPTWSVGHSGYVKGCRCKGCREGNRAYWRKWNADNADAAKVARRRRWRRMMDDDDRKARVCESQLARRRKLRNWLNELKMATGCVDCGYKAHPAALDFDHVGDDKVFSIGQCLTLSRKRVLAEIAKCVIRCSNCHRVKTHERMVAKMAATQSPS